MTEITDITFKICNVRVNCRAVAIIIDNDKILFQKREKDTVWSLPGGKTAILETGEDTIKRELEEETGAEIKIKEKLGFYENFFTYDEEQFHEYMFMYSAAIKNNKLKRKKYFDGIEKQKHLKFAWFDKEDLDRVSIAPIEIKEKLKEMIDTEEKSVVKSRVRR